MTESRRGKNVALVGAVLQCGFIAAALLAWLKSDSLAAMSCLWVLIGGLATWLVTILLFYCRQMVDQETAELEDIAAKGGAEGAMFSLADGELPPAQRQLRWVQRWLIPIFTLLWALGHATAAVMVCRYLQRSDTIAREPAIGALFMLLAAFPGFLLGYYCMGMGRQGAWRPLRATGSYMLVSVYLAVAAGASLAIGYFGYPGWEHYVAYIAPLVQIVLAAELVLNLVLDFYRPRLAGQDYRPSFDSRLLNTIAEPARMGHSIAEALNYQFGFEISKTWFYKLVGRAMTPLLICGVLILGAMSSVVIVNDGQQAVLRRMGRFDPSRGLLAPGIHLKLPWPFEMADMFDVQGVHELLLGSSGDRTQEEIDATIANGREMCLWKQEHGHQKEMDFLIAVPPRRTHAKSSNVSGEKPPPPVNIIKLMVSVHYVVTDPYRFGYRFADGSHVLQCLASREMTRYCASATLDSPVQDSSADSPEAIMTYGRQHAGEEMQRRIQATADQLDLGVRLTRVGLISVHPPSRVAGEFESVLCAQRAQEQQRFAAEAVANQMLAEVAGSPTGALKLALAIRKLENLEELQRQRSNPVQFQAKIAEHLRVAAENVKELHREIETERQMGKIHEGDKTRTEQLAGDYEAYRAMLGSVAAAGPQNFDAGLLTQASVEVDKQFAEAVGEPAKLVAEASSYRWSKELQEQARSESLPKELLAYNASPRMYMLDRWLDVWAKALPGIYKYVLAVEPQKVEFWLDWHREMSGLERAYDDKK